jgi:aspartate racemase
MPRLSGEAFVFFGFFLVFPAWPQGCGLSHRTGISRPFEAAGESMVHGGSGEHCLGLIGGLGVGSAVHYYKSLAEGQEALGRRLNLLMIHADMKLVFQHVQGGATEELAQYFAELIRRLRDGGADIATIPAVMAHICMSHLAGISVLPLISLVDALRSEIASRGIRRLALFGTRYVVESRLFGGLGEVEVITPRADEVDFIHAIYVRMAEERRGTDEQRRSLTALAHRLCERERLDAIVLAGTDLSLIFDASNTEFPHVDAAQVHLQAILRALGGDVV